MDHLLLKAATTATDQGIFEAVISTASEDRDGDIVEPFALVKALAKWADIGKLVPLAYSHRDPSTGHFVVVGHIDPATARVDGNQVITKGFVDQSTERGAETWRLVKSGTLSFSYGYLVPEGGATKRAGKKTGFHITELDLYEISVVPVGPANNETRVLEFKSAEDLRKESERRERELAEVEIPDAEVVEVEPHPLSKAFGSTDFGEMTPEQIADRLDKFALTGDVRLYVRAIPADESEGVVAGEIKAVWTTAYINNLPDSAFLYVESGGKKDSEGKTTPRGLRHFPVKDASGNVDLPHLRNALSRIPQSNLPNDVKDRAAARAQKMLDSATKSVEVDKGPGARSTDPLRRRSEELALELASDGLSLKKSTKPPEKPELVPLDALKRQSRDYFTDLLET